MTPTRRTLLRSVSGIALATVAGSTLTGATATPAADRARNEAAQDFNSALERDCDGDEHRASIALDTRRATVAGQLVTPTPCHDPVLEDVDYGDSTLGVTIGADAPDDGTACADVISCARYKEAVRLPGDTGYTDLEVVHDGAGGAIPALEATVSTGTPEYSNCHQPMSTEDEAASDADAEDDADAAAVETEDNVVYFSGHLVAPTPCHEVVFRRVEFDGDDLTVELGLASTLEPGHACIQVIACLPYRGRVRLPEGASPDDVTVIGGGIGHSE
ncbi:hypothetical protein [Natronobiforma cellulositropha]|uniref:hypothetical protein n=1 Tax=Natronobiforma cellulositropha TaxID=1679076 RepID=UPI0021D610BB|nr:hypothetical protein [Natronobiforma cellulositropha]